MSKDTRVESSKDPERYNSSSVPAIWIVLAASVLLVAIAMIGATA